MSKNDVFTYIIIEHVNTLALLIEFTKIKIPHETITILRRQEQITPNLRLLL